jgi:hypothetical protein
VVRGFPQRRRGRLPRPSALRHHPALDAGEGRGRRPGTDADRRRSDTIKGPLTDFRAQFLGGLYADIHPIFYRTVLATPHGNEALDATIEQRRHDPDLRYNPLNPGLP